MSFVVQRSHNHEGQEGAIKSASLV